MPSRAVAGAVALSLLAGTTAAVFAADPMMPPASGRMASTATMARGSFRKGEAPVSGSFQIRREGGRQLLLLSDDFKTNDMAPDLKVVFSPSTTPLAASKPPAYPLQAGTYTILAPLKSAAGAQSYVIPASIDLSRQGSVLIWCQKFNATMAWAPLRS